MNEPMPNKVALTPGEFAALFGKSQTWGYRQLYAGKVQAITQYGRVMIPVSEVERILGEAGRYNGAAACVKLKADKKVASARKNEGGNVWIEAILKRRITPSSAGRKGRNGPPSKEGKASKGISASRRRALRRLFRNAP